MGNVAHASLPLDRLAWLARLQAATGARARDVPGGTPVIRPGERSPAFHAVRAGAVAVVACREDGSESIAQILGAGQVFGTLGMGSRPDARSGARTLVRSSIVSMSPPDVWAVVGRDPELARAIVGALAERIDRLEADHAASVGGRVGDRLLAVLRRLAVDHGRPVGDGELVELGLTQDALASLVGATRESVNRALRDLTRERALRRTRRGYVLLSPGGTARHAEGARP